MSPRCHPSPIRGKSHCTGHSTRKKFLSWIFRHFYTHWNAYATCVLSTLFNPIQLGVGVSGGCEAAVHATRRYAENMPATHCIVKLDFINAFNSLHRDAMLQAAHDNIPGIYKFCHLAYSRPSILAFSDRTILSEEGPQQGDPLGAALFCVTIHPLLTSLSSELEIGYMDDLTLGGNKKQVAGDVKTVESQGQEFGLRLNTKKCEIINASGSSTEPIFSDFTHLNVQNASLLGAPVTVGQAMDSMLASCCDDLTRAVSRLKLINAHDALILLRASFCAPKVMHTLRSSPCAGHPQLELFDKLLRGCVESITNTELTDLQWTQATLPVRNGGLGVRRVSSLAPSAFLASAAGTRDLQALILSKCQCPIDSHILSVMSVWTSRLGPASTVAPDSGKQHSWDHLLSQTPETKPDSWLRLLHTVATGSMLSPSPRVDCVLTMSRSGSLSGYVLAASYASHTNVHAGPKLTRLDLMACRANKAPEGQLVTSSSTTASGVHCNELTSHQSKSRSV